MTECQMTLFLDENFSTDILSNDKPSNDKLSTDFLTYYNTVATFVRFSKNFSFFISRGPNRKFDAEVRSSSITSKSISQVGDLPFIHLPFVSYSTFSTLIFTQRVELDHACSSFRQCYKTFLRP